MRFSAWAGRLLFPWIAALALGLTTIVTACDDGNSAPSDGENAGPSLDEYFQGVDAAVEKSRAASLQAQNPQSVLQDPDATLREKKDAVTTFFDGFLATTGGLLADLEALDPPDDAREAHDEMLAALRGVVQAGEDTRDNRVGAAQSETTLQNILNEFFSPDGPQAALGPPCVALREVAEDNDVGVDLGC